MEPFKFPHCGNAVHVLETSCKRNQADTAVSIIQCYVPPLVLSETIETMNAQQTLDV